MQEETISFADAFAKLYAESASFRETVDRTNLQSSTKGHTLDDAIAAISKRQPVFFQRREDDKHYIGVRFLMGEPDEQYPVEYGVMLAPERVGEYLKIRDMEVALDTRT